MPCDDVTETLKVTLDAHERISSYELRKRTCGGAVGGQSLLLPFVRGMAMRNFLETTPETMMACALPKDEEEAFFTLKHYFALRLGLEAMTGCRSGGLNSPDAECVVAQVGYDSGGWVLEADIAVGIATEKIRACGLCKGCGSSRSPRKNQAPPGTP